LLSISGGHVLHSLPEDPPYSVDRDPHKDDYDHDDDYDDDYYDYNVD
jgi:hypothetical protein